MIAREYLTQARMIDSRINSKLMELQRARELATKATGLVSDMPRNPSPDLQQMESRVVKIVDLEREINAEIDELVDLKRDIRELIAQIRKPLQDGAGASVSGHEDLARYFRGNAVQRQNHLPFPQQRSPGGGQAPASWKIKIK